jgi:hypothetical protein
MYIFAPLEEFVRSTVSGALPPVGVAEKPAFTPFTVPTVTVWLAAHPAASVAVMVYVPAVSPLYVGDDCGVPPFNVYV